MPGLTGIFTLAQSETRLANQVRVLNHFDYSIKKGELANYHAAVIGHHFSTLDIVNIDDRFLLSFFGDIFGDSTFPGPDFYRTFVNDFILHGGKYLARLNAQYQAAVYDQKENSLFLITDRSGSRPLYYCWNGDSFAYACEVKALLANNSDQGELNEQAIANLFSMGFVGFKNTFFKNIHNLGPAQILTFKDGRTGIETYYSLPYNEELMLKTRFTKPEIDALMEQAYALLDAAVRDQIDHKKIFIALSGGLDSRFITAIAHKYLPKHFTTYTFGNPKNTDILYAREVAHLLNTSHNEFMVDPKLVWDFGKHFAFLSDGMSMINGPIQAVQAVYSLKDDNHVLLAAQAADAMWGSSLSHNKVRRLLTIGPVTAENFMQFDKLFEKISETERHILFEPDFLKDKTFDHTIFQDYFPQAMGKHPFYLYQNLLYFEYTRRGVGGGNLLNNFYFDMRMPSFDRDLLEFVTNLPLQLKFNQYLYRKTFIRYFSNLAKIRRNDTDLPIDAPKIFHNLRKKERKIVQRLKKSPVNVILKKFSRYNEYNYVDYKAWFQNELNALLKEILFDPQTLSRPFYRKGGIKRLYELHMNTDIDQSKILWQIVNLEYFFKNFAKHNVGIETK
jgi:asparagine synthetase B (glutamine-hydrolysing)